MLLAFLLGGAVAVADSPVAVPVEIGIAVQGASPQRPVAVKVRASPVGHDAQAVSWSFEAPASRLFDLGAGGAWSVVAEADGYWAAEQTVLAREGTHAVVSLTLWPAAALEGRIAVPEGEAPVTSVNVRFRPISKPDTPESPPEGEVACAIEIAIFSCQLPAGMFDLRIRARGFVSHYLWGQTLGIGERRKLGTFPLRRGASVVGWVETASGLPASSCTVALTPKPGGAMYDPTERERAKDLVLSVRTDGRGFFHLQGLPPGNYVLTATQAPFSPARFFPVLVKENSESELQKPLVLRPPLRLALSLKPPLDPWQRPWLVSLLQISDTSMFGETVATGEKAANGSWEARNLSPGRYVVRVSDEDASNWAWEEVELPREPEVLEMTIAIVPVKGTVTLGDKPVRALVIFGGEHGSTTIRIFANKAGEYKGFLPREGPWPVRVVLPQPPIRRDLDGVAVHRSEGEQEATVDIRLPGTALEGEVVDEGGAAVGNAIVTTVDAEHREFGTESRCDAQGQFRLEGLGPGTIRVEARGGGRSSQVVTVELNEGAEPAKLRLVLADNIKLNGRVLGRLGPVGGAGVAALALGGGLRTRGVDATTNADGRFSLSLPWDVQEVTLAVTAPGFALRAMRWRVVSAEELSIQVDQDGGSLVVRLSQQSQSGQQTGFWVVVHNGCALPLGFFGPWRTANGVSGGDQQGVVIPQLEPGDYSLCWVPYDFLPLLAAGVLPAKNCTAGYLSRNGLLTLVAPALPASGGKGSS
jgi:hypothetical protein